MGRHEHKMYETCAKEQEMEVKMEVKEGVKMEVKTEEIKEKRNVKDVMFFGEKFAY